MIAWFIRALSSSPSARVANAVVGALGVDGLDRYLSAIDATIPGNSDVARLLRTTVANLPDPSVSVLHVRSGPSSFLYGTAPEDALCRPSRRNFENWEPASRILFALLARDARRVVDIGAYSGLYALTAASANPVAEVVAFEPGAVMAHLAQANIERNRLSQRVTLIRSAVGQTAGTSRLFWPPEGTSGASMLPVGSVYDEVPVTTLDREFASRPIDLMKVDVEGWEAAVYEGGRNVLMRDVPVIIAEALSDEELDDQGAVLNSLGYTDPIPVNSADTHGDERNFVWTGNARRAEVLRLLSLARFEASQRIRRPK